VNLNTNDFLRDKKKITKALRNEIDHGDIDLMARVRSMKRSL